jgi:methyl-accepting chemotaxis protein
MLEQKRLEIRHSVDGAATIVKAFLPRSKVGELTEIEAHRRASDALRAACFDGGNYFYIYDFDDTTLLNPARPDLEGKNDIGLKDMFGKPIVMPFLDIARQREGVT